jgi:hypothetical protein
MSLHRRAARRDKSEAPIVDVLKKLGWSVQALSLRDAPDLLLGKNKITLLAEVKTGTGKLKPGQQDWHDNWRGFPVVVLRTPDDAIKLTNKLHNYGVGEPSQD